MRYHIIGHPRLALLGGLLLTTLTGCGSPAAAPPTATGEVAVVQSQPSVPPDSSPTPPPAPSMTPAPPATLIPTLPPPTLAPPTETAAVEVTAPPLEVPTDTLEGAPPLTPTTPITGTTPEVSEQPIEQPPTGTDVIVSLMTEGGITGKGNPPVTILADGTVMRGVESFKLAEGAMADFQKAMDETGVYAVEPGTYMPKNTCCDRFTYTLTLYKDGQTYTYTTIDGSENAPDALLDALDLIRATAFNY